MANIKISQLPNINGNITSNSLIPIVSTNGTFTTDKITLGILANYILNNAGIALANANIASLSYNVVNAAQPNITSVGTLNSLTVVGTTNLGYPADLILLGGNSGQVLSTNGTGNLSWIDQIGATGATGPIGDSYSTTSTSNITIALGNITLTVGANLAYTVGQDITVVHDSNNYMNGPVITYDRANGELVFDSIQIVGTGSYNSWTVNLDGAAGGIGATGATGIDGSTGATGSTGLPGIIESNTAPVDTSVLWLNPNTPGTLGIGSTGATGATGLTGATGEVGPQGTTGPIGATGEIGPTGSTGLSGIVESNTAPVDTSVLWLNPSTPGTQGIGATGATGPAGSIGVDGSTGATGLPGIVESNTAPVDTSVIWLNTNTSGVQGIGATGSTGPQGATGVNGTIGVDGSTGATGPAGIDGATGVAGPTGATGPAGSNGSDGATGVQGATGATGAGATGATGIFGGALTQNLDGNGFDITNVETFSANTLQGTSPNVTLTAGSFSATFDNTGILTLPAMGGDEGGEINLGIPATNTTLTTRVVVDVFQNRFRIFDGSTKGAYIDLSQATVGVGTLLNNRVSAFVNAGTFVTMDNLKATVTTSGNRGLSLATVSGFYTYDIGGTYGTAIPSSGGSAGTGTLTTTPTASIFNWGFTIQGDISTYIITNTSSMQAYRITLQIGNAFNNNMISIERLI